MGQDRHTGEYGDQPEQNGFHDQETEVRFGVVFSEIQYHLHKVVTNRRPPIDICACLINPFIAAWIPGSLRIEPVS